MVRLWEHTDAKMADRPPVCVIACAWYPPIRMRALAYPDTTVNNFLCSLHLPDVLYRVLTGNRPTRIYIGNECRIVDGYGEHRSSKAPARHITISLRLVTHKGKCTLLCPDQPLNLKSDALAELVCCETIMPTTTREIRLSIPDRNMSENEERAFSELQRANYQWLWSRALEPPVTLTQPSGEDLRPLPPWKRNKFEWVETLKRLRDSKTMASMGHLSSNVECVASARNGVRKQPIVAKRQRTVESSTLEGFTERRVNHIHESTQPNVLDEPHLNVPVIETSDIASTPKKPMDDRPQTECVGGMSVGEDTPVHDGLGSPLGKAVSDLDVIIETFKSASPDDMGSPLKKAISRLAGNIETLASASKNDSNGLNDAISHLGDNIEHLRTLTNSMSSNHADKGKDKNVKDNDPGVTNLALQSSETDFPSHVNHSGSDPTENELHRQPYENQLPTCSGDSTDNGFRGKGISQRNKAEGDQSGVPKGPILVPHQPAIQEPGLTRVWSDVDDDDGPIALPNDDADVSLGETGSTSSSSSSSSNSSSTDSAESSSDSGSDSSDSDSDSTESSDEAQDQFDTSSDINTPNEDNLKTNSTTTSNSAWESSKQSIEMSASTSNESSEPCPPSSSQGTHSPLAKTDFDTPTAIVGKSASNLHDLNLIPVSNGDNELPKSNNSDLDLSKTLSDNNTSGSGSQSDSNSSSSSSDSETSSSGESEDEGMEISTERTKTSDMTKARTVAETMEDYKTTPNHDGAMPTTASGNKRRRRPLLSSKKKIII